MSLIGANCAQESIIADLFDKGQQCEVTMERIHYCSSWHNEMKLESYFCLGIKVCLVCSISSEKN